MEQFFNLIFLFTFSCEGFSDFPSHIEHAFATVIFQKCEVIWVSFEFHPKPLLRVSSTKIGFAILFFIPRL